MGHKIAFFITKGFTIWIVLIAAVAFFLPAPFAGLGKFVPYLLGIVMLGMGLTMTPNDFKLVLTRPKDVLIGVVARCVIMPGVAFCVAHAFGLPPYLAAGLILVGCCPSGTASNVMTFIAKGDTALSVTVASVVTVLAPILTPFTFLLLAGTFIEVNATALLLDILIIVLLPISLGTLIRYFFAKKVDKVREAIPAVSVIAIVLIVGAVVSNAASSSGAALASVAVIACLSVVTHNSLGLFLGFWSAKAFKMPTYKAKAICFEIGMENSGLAVTLALAHLEPMAAIPGVIFSVWHNFSGSLLASYWANKAKKKGLVPGESAPLESAPAKSAPATA